MPPPVHGAAMMGKFIMTVSSLFIIKEKAKKFIAIRQNL